MRNLLFILFFLSSPVFGQVNLPTDTFFQYNQANGAFEIIFSGVWDNKNENNKIEIPIQFNRLGNGTTDLTSTYQNSTITEGNVHRLQRKMDPIEGKRYKTFINNPRNFVGKYDTLRFNDVPAGFYFLFFNNKGAIIHEYIHIPNKDFFNLKPDSFIYTNQKTDL